MKIGDGYLSLVSNVQYGSSTRNTVLVTIKLPFYARATGTGVARVRVRA